MNSISERVKKEREARGITLEELAKGTFILISEENPLNQDFLTPIFSSSNAKSQRPERPVHSLLISCGLG